MTKKTNLRGLYLLFFLTGITGLIYQVVWARCFGLVFGNTIYASSTVLSAYMGGLALGSFVSGKWMAGRMNGLKAYAGMELMVGIFGIGMPAAIHLLSSVYSSIFRAFNPSFEVLTAIRFFLSFILLMIPCTFMGATLPLLSKYITDLKGSHGHIIGRLYGINTLGAVLGSFSSGFFLIGSAGITLTSLIAAAINACVALTAFCIYRLYKKSEAQNDCKAAMNDKTAAQPGLVLNKNIPGWVLLLCSGLSGFSSIALEVGWTRALVWIMGADSYAFAAMLTVMLSGIGIGSIIFSKIKARVSGSTRLLYGTQLLIGVFVLLSIFAIQNSFSINTFLISLVNMNQITFRIFEFLGALTLTQMILAAAIFFIPSLLMGFSFPLFAMAYIRVNGHVGKGMGNIYSINTLGAIFGSVLMGFVIIPLAGILPAIAMMAGVYFTSAVLIALKAGSGTRNFKAALGICTVVIFVVLSFTVNLDFKAFLKKTMGDGSDRQDEKLVYFKEHASGGVMVKESAKFGTEMIIDGVQVASTGQHDLHSHLYPAHLMSFLKKDPEDVLIVAFGAGGTSGSMLLYDEVRKLDAVEICQGVVEPAKQFFARTNKNVFDDPRFNLILQDGKNYMHMAQKKYDIIYSGPIHPQSNQGSAALYTKDYFEDCAARLKDDGFQCLWLPLHMAAQDDFKSIVKSFMAVYPHVTLWQLPETESSVSHPHLIGSKVPVYPDYQLISNKLKTPGVREDLGLMGDTSFSEPYEFISQLAIGEDNMKKWVADTDRLNTDDKPVVEFFTRPMNLLIAQKISKCALLVDILKYMENPYTYVKNVPEDKKEALKKQLDRLYAGNKELLQGHYYYTAKNFLALDLDTYVDYYYDRALKEIPESIYLKNYFQTRK